MRSTAANARINPGRCRGGPRGLPRTETGFPHTCPGPRRRATKNTANSAKTPSPPSTARQILQPLIA